MKTPDFKREIIKIIDKQKHSKNCRISYYLDKYVDKCIKKYSDDITTLCLLQKTIHEIHYMYELFDGSPYCNPYDKIGTIDYCWKTWGKDKFIEAWDKIKWNRLNDFELQEIGIICFRLKRNADEMKYTLKNFYYNN